MADRKVKLIIEIDDRDVAATEKSLERLGVATKRVGDGGADVDKMTGAMTKASFAGNLLADVVQRLPELTFRAVKGSFDLAAAYSELGVRVSKAREITGMQIDMLSALEAQSRRIGTSYDDIGESLKNFTRLIGDANNGSDDALAKMKRLGIEPVKAAKDLDGAFAQVLKRIVQLPEGVSQGNAAMDAFGESGYKLLPFIKSFNGDLDLLIAKAREMGLVLGTEDVAAAKEFDKSFKDVQDRLRAVGIAFGRELAEPAKAALDSIDGWLKDNKNEVKNWADSLVFAITRVAQEVKMLGYAAERTQLLMDWDWTGGMVDGEEAHRKWQQKWDNLESRIAANDVSIDKTKAGQFNGSNWNNQPDEYQMYREGKLPFATSTAPYNRPEDEKKKKKAAKAKARTGPSPEALIIIKRAQEIGVTPLDYATFLLYEGAGSLSTSTWGGTGNKYLGPMQMGPEERVRYGNKAGVGTVKPGMSLDNYLAAANAYLVDRGVKPGMGLPELYTAINYGNIRSGVKWNASDGNGTIREHLQKMVRDRRPQAQKLLEGATGTGTNITGDVDRMLQQQSDALTKERRETLLDSIIDLYSRFGIIPDDKMMGDITRRLQDLAREEGVLQPDAGEVRSVFQIAQAKRATEIASTDPTVGGNVRMQAMTLLPGQQYVKDLRESLGLEVGINGELSRGAMLIARKVEREAELNALLDDQNQTREEDIHNLSLQLDLLRQIDIGEEAKRRLMSDELNMRREILDIQVELTNVGKLDQLEREKDYLNDILTIERSRLQLNRAMEVSQERIVAGVYEHMASQKTLNQGIVDGINGTYDAILKRMNEPLDKLNSKTGGLLSIVTEPLKAMQAQNLNSLFTGVLDKVFPGMGSQMEKAKNPVVGELKDHTKLLEQIARNTGGLPMGYNPTMGGGISSILGNVGVSSGTPGFNPNASGQLQNIANQQSNAGSGGGSDALGMAQAEAKRAAQVFPSMLQTAGSIVPGRVGRVLSGAGMGMQLGMMFGPVGSMIGTGLGALFGLFSGGFGDNANKKIKEAVLSEYGVTVKDKAVLKSLKELGELYFGKGKVGANARQLVQTDEAREIIKNYAAASGQSSDKINFMYHGDENWSGNQFRGRFGGFRAMGGPVTAGMSYIVGERRPELFTPSVNGTILPAVPNTSTTSGADSNQIAMLAESVAMLSEQVARLQTVSAGRLLQMGVDENPKAVRDGYERELHADPRSTRSLNELTGAII